MSAGRQDAAAAKAALRRHYRQVRRQALAEGGIGLAEGIRCRALAAARELEPGQHLGLYWPLAGEIDLRALALELPLALPAIHQHRLVYRPWQPGQPLEADACGIPAPPASVAELPPDQLGLLLVPALAIDPAGIRLGYGGGWYDRLRSQPAWRQVPALAVLPAACCEAVLPRDPWDVPFGGWIHERGHHPVPHKTFTGIHAPPGCLPGFEPVQWPQR